MPARRRPAILLAALALVAAFLVPPVTTAEAAESSDSYSDIRAEWGINGVHQEASGAGGGCWYFSAGPQEEFAAAHGDVRIIKRLQDGTSVPVTRENACLGTPGVELGQRMQFNSGQGTFDATRRVGELRWEGTALANGYGGLVPWWLRDPKLTFPGDGTATLTAVVGGWSSSRTNSTQKTPVRERTVTVATFSDIVSKDATLTLTPDYSGVDYAPLVTPGDPSSRRGPSVVPRTVTGWGSWPQSFVDFQYETGLASYWHTSGGPTDGKKAGSPLIITLGEKDEPAAIPLVREHVTIDRDRPLVEGQPVTFTARIDGADTYQWEIAPEPDGPYTPIPGQTTQTWRVPSVDRATFHDRFVRLSGSNAAGTVSAGYLYVRTEPFRPLTITAQPQPVHAIEGTRPTLAFTADGMPVAKKFAAERSTDGGRTWTAVPGTTYQRWQLGALDRVTLPPARVEDDGTLLRGVATTADGTTVRTAAVAASVVAATGRPQVSARSLPGFTPEDGGEIWVAGAGFDVPPTEQGGSYSLDVGLFEDGDWAPGRAGHRDWIATSEASRYGQLYRDALRRADGAFGLTIAVPPGALSADGDYGVGAFLRQTDRSGRATFDNRALDAWSLLATEPPRVEPSPAPRADDDEPRASGASTVGVEAPAARPDGPAGRTGLASTGGAAGMGPLLLGVVLLIAGGALAVARRRPPRRP